MKQLSDTGYGYRNAKTSFYFISDYFPYPKTEIEAKLTRISSDHPAEDLVLLFARQFSRTSRLRFW